VVTYLTALISLIHRNDDGQGLAEYALILAVVAIAAIAAMVALSGQIGVIFGKVSTSL
jgi:pilus assembly protein Flp/PilA